MGFFSNIFKKKETVVDQPQSNYGSDLINNNLGRTYNQIVYDSFDGEKTPGELGDILDTVPDYLGLRLRAYDLNLILNCPIQEISR